MTNAALALAVANTAPHADDDDEFGDVERAAAWLSSVGSADVSLPELRAAREAVVALLDAALIARPLPDDAVGRVNALSESAPIHTRLETGQLAYVAYASPGEMFLAEVASGTIELVGTSLRPRLRRCRRPGCGRFFLSNRPNHRWCSSRCQGRARRSGS